MPEAREYVYDRLRREAREMTAATGLVAPENIVLVEPRRSRRQEKMAGYTNSKSTGRAPSAVRSTAPHAGHSSSAVKHTAGGSGRAPVTTPAAHGGTQNLTRPTPRGGGKTPSLNISGVVPAVAPAVQPSRAPGKSGRGPTMNIKTGKC